MALFDWMKGLIPSTTPREETFQPGPPRREHHDRPSRGARLKLLRARQRQRLARRCQQRWHRWKRNNHRRARQVVSKRI